MEAANRTHDLSSAALHIIAMTCMLFDHAWATVVTGNEWMTCVGRIAFPIFAFLLVEGFYHTHDLKKYLRRLLIFALISEIPFNLVAGGSFFYPFHQNVLWTFLISLLCISLVDRLRQRCSLIPFLLISFVILFVGFALGFLTFVDYYGYGVLTVAAFYFFRGRKWWCYLGQAAALFWINWEALGGQMYPVTLGSLSFHIPQQGFALLALIPIWLYHGRQGLHSKKFRYFCYAFYPVHLLILGVLALLLW